jgi:hypothetical protein
LTTEAPPIPALIVGLLAGMLAASGPAAAQPKPKTVDLQELGSATIVITFQGRIVTEGYTKSLVYVQPLPAEDDHQEILEVDADGGSVGAFSFEVEKDGPGRRIVLTWEEVDGTVIPYEIRVKVRRDSFRHAITSVTRGSDKAMLKHGTLTETSKEIKQKSAALAKGSKSDLETALRLAQWINENVEYDIHYSQDKKDKTAPQVFKKKRGTCDELSHLFITMSRSTGLPTREVSGLAFNGDIWGFHSWSEVKLQDRWVPVDATNMQIGFVDATHLAFARDYDDAKFEQKIARMGEGAFTVQDHSMDVRIWKASRLDARIKVAFTADPAEVPPQWDFALKAEVRNVSDSYIAGPVRIIIPEEFHCVDGAQKTFLLAPGEKTVLQWKVTTGASKSAEGAYFYKLGAITFPRVVAEADLTVATRMIKNVGAFRGEGNTVAVDVTIENLFKEPKSVDLEVCFYSDWEMTAQATCEQGKGELAASSKKTFTIESKFAPEGNFAVEVRALSGSLSERRILKVDIKQ